jgi:Tol biopolymer transport system component
MKDLQRNQSVSRARWAALLAAGLALETCILGTLVGIWWAGRSGLGLPSVFTGSLTGEILPSIAPNEDIPFDATPIGILLTPENEASPAAPGADLPAVEEIPDSVALVGKIVFTCFDGSFDQICIMNADGSGQRQLTNEAATHFYPSLAADGESIVFSSNRDGNFEIYRMNANGGDLAQLTDNLGSLYAAEVSPNGRRIVFTAEGGGKQNIWLMRIDGSNPRALTDSGSDIDPTWSPDGEKIAFVSAREGRNQIYVMSADGQNPRPIAASILPRPGGRLDWSPDGQWLGAYGGPEGQREVYLVHVSSGEVIQMTNGGDNLAPSFSPDGGWIVFTSFRTGNNDLFVLSLDGQGPYRITNRILADWQPRWGP